ncbi:putative hydrolase [Gordonia effusa NBRC 100432]|uniref:Putative hydrolase n=1 Tax=Gordonia effusa NBRC 100432 TaxID=1077974 RepID=H0R4D1_9ACTN|nr:alpha/beta fold hydrolase [Gordonia effusa]GAB19932.1 putative hydrolase [Gordonia effusa NBRC 100432]
MVDWRKRIVTNNGVDLAVFELGDPANPAVVLVHGWPDTHHLWTHVGPLLVDAGYYVAAYDTRGYGETSIPSQTARYRVTELAADLFAIADAVSPAAPVHVMGHDWGSIQSWEAVTTPGAERRLKSFISVSGPNLNYMAEWVRKSVLRPSPANLVGGLLQAISSAYTGFFRIPLLTNLFWRLAGRPAIWREFLRRSEGTKKSQIVLGDTFNRDTVNGMRYYRANIRPTISILNTRPAKIPVLEIINERDIALRPAIYTYTYQHVDRLWRRSSATGHWLPYTNPRYLAATAIEFLDSLEGRTLPRRPNGMDRARVRSQPGKLSGKLAVITSATSTYGRDTASLLAESGCEVIVAAHDLADAADIARECESKGALAHSYALNVADTDGFNEFAATVAARHGVPDIVINDVGGGLSGSNAFGPQMVERGAGGKIVNIASAVASNPLSAPLRADLARNRVVVSTIRPGAPKKVARSIVAALKSNGRLPL